MWIYMMFKYNVLISRLFSLKWFRLFIKLMNNFRQKPPRHRKQNIMVKNLKRINRTFILYCTCVWPRFEFIWSKLHKIIQPIIIWTQIHNKHICMVQIFNCEMWNHSHISSSHEIMYGLWSILRNVAMKRSTLRWTENSTEELRKEGGGELLRLQDRYRTIDVQKVTDTW